MKPPSKLTRARALEIATLDRGASRRKSGQFLIEGWRSVESASRAGARLLEVIVRVDLIDDPRLDLLRSLTGDNRCQVLVTSAKTSANLAGVVQDQGIIAVAEIPVPRLDALDGARRIVALDGVQDPGNVGTIVRGASWFGFDAVIAGPGTADFFNPKVVRSMAGALWDVDLLTVDNLPRQLNRLGTSGCEIVGADLHGLPMTAWKPRGRVVLVLGSEAHGPRDDTRETIETLVRIEGGSGPKAGVESLNVAVAGGIIMHQMRAKTRGQRS